MSEVMAVKEKPKSSRKLSREKIILKKLNTLIEKLSVYDRVTIEEIKIGDQSLLIPDPPKNSPLKTFQEEIRQARLGNGFDNTLVDKAIMKAKSSFHVPFRQMSKTILQAKRAGLHQHKTVEEWIQTRKILGNWEWLRRPRIGLEKKVKKPFTIDEVRKSKMIDDLRKQGKNWEDCRQTLIKQGNTWGSLRTPQGFDKFVRKLGLKGFDKIIIKHGLKKKPASRPSKTPPHPSST